MRVSRLSSGERFPAASRARSSIVIRPDRIRVLRTVSVRRPAFRWALVVFSVCLPRLTVAVTVAASESLRSTLTPWAIVLAWTAVRRGAAVSRGGGGVAPAVGVGAGSATGAVVDAGVASAVALAVGVAVALT